MLPLKFDPELRGVDLYIFKPAIVEKEPDGSKSANHLNSVLESSSNHIEMSCCYLPSAGTPLKQ